MAKAGEYVIRGQVDIKDGVVGLFEPLPQEYDETLLGTGLVETDVRGLIPIRIWTSKDGVRFKKGRKFGSFSVCQQSESKKQGSNELIGGLNVLSMDERWKLLAPKFELRLNELPEVERQALKPLLKSFSDIFSVNKSDIGLTTLVKHEIDTGNEGPIVCQHRRVPIHLEEKVENLIKDLEKKGIIRESESAWNAPLVVVPKKNGDIRLTVDYRKLNAITKRPIFPIPETRHLLDTLHGSAYFTTLDLSSGYYNVPMHESDIGKTAFSTRKNHWEFVRMPMGLSTSPSTFQRVMHKVFDKENWHQCLIYLDDILVFSRSLEEQTERLRTIFERIRSAGLKLSPEKCDFFKKEVSYLGYTITSQGTKTDEKKISKIKNWPIPKSAEDLRSWIGLCGYYRHFIRNYAQMVAPLEKLCKIIWNKKKKKATDIEWSAECQESFDKLKEALTKAPVLTYPTKEGKFILDTDASHDCMGSVLSQVQEGQERVIAYGSKKFSQSQRQYCITRKELLAVHHFVHHFKHYLLGRRFVVRTDHRALTWMLNWKNPNTSQYCRWKQELEIYDMVVEYRPGKEHMNADALSRLQQCQQCELKHPEPKHKAKVKHMNERKDEMFCRNIVSFETDTDQMKDKDLAKIIGLLKEGKISEEKPDGIMESGTEAIKLWSKRSKLRLRGGLLYLLDERSQYRLLVPHEDRQYLVKMTHENFAHMGVKKTLSLLAEKYYWINMNFDVKLYVGACKSCAEKKNSPKKQHTKGSLQANYPFQKISIDITGPLPGGSHGEKYILGIIDNFSRYASLIPLQRATAGEVARALYERWITVFGAPDVIHSDRGTEFENKVIYELCALFGIRKSKSSPYYPQGNGIIERLFRTVKDMLYATMKATGKNWTKILPTVEMALRCSHNSSNTFSPYEIIFGKPMTTPFSHDAGNDAKYVYNACEYIHFIKNSLKIIHDMIIKKREGQMCSNSPEDGAYAEGDTVMAKIFPTKHGIQFPRYDGPYVITRRRGWCYTLKHVKTKKVIERNHVHIKLYRPVKKKHQDEIGTSIESTTSNKNNVEIRRRQDNDNERRYPTRNRKPIQKYGFP